MQPANPRLDTASQRPANDMARELAEGTPTALRQCVHESVCAVEAA
jgi:hypothetical protein